MYRKKRIRAAWISVALAVFLFLLASTRFFPECIVRHMEDTYEVFDHDEFWQKEDPVLVHVLGGGHSPDPNLPPNAQLGLATLGRLTEGLRITSYLEGSLLITSGNSLSGDESQASVVKRAAISMGFDSTRIRTLDAPATTEEEAQALASVFGGKATVVVVTDAIHMPRAMRLFREAGFHPYPAPTNFLIKGGSKGSLNWLPSVRNISLTDQLLHEFLGNVKIGVFKAFGKN